MKKIVVFFAFLVVAHVSVSQDRVRLYPAKAPGSESWNWTEAVVEDPRSGRIVYNVVDPELLIFRAPKEKANGTAIVIAPGGAFHILSIDNEGIEVAKRLNELGITAFVLKYRVVHSLTDNPFQELMPLMNDFKKLDEINAPVVEMATMDGIEAMKYVRKRATEYSIDPKKVGFMGFSAGGTLTMSVLLSAPQDQKPNFIAPIYLYGPAVIGHQMPSTSTPIFVAVATDDQLGFVPHSLTLYQKWMTEKMPAELHVYEKGGHGFGIRPHGTTSDHWFSDFENWLRARKLI